MIERRVLVLPGDNIGPEIVSEAIKVLTKVDEIFNLNIEFEYGELGGAAIDACGHPCSNATLEKAKAANAILLGAVGGPQWDHVDLEIRPEKGLLAIRSELDLFGNLRPAIMYPQLSHASSLKPEYVSGLDILIVRELVGGIILVSQEASEPLRMVRGRAITPIGTRNQKSVESPAWPLRRP